MTTTIPADCQLSKERVTWIGDSHHRGTEIYWSDRLEKWVVVDLENELVSVHERLAFYRYAGDDADSVGLNQRCVACDLDGPGLWVLPEDAGDAEAIGVENVAVF